VRALVATQKAGIPLTFDQACALDLAGFDVMEAVRTKDLRKLREWLSANVALPSSPDGG